MRKRMRGGVALGAVVAASLVLAACGSSDSESSTPGGDTGGPTGSISIDGSQPENPLIPTATNETGGGNVVDAMWTGLVNYDPETGAPENAMAESIESTDNTNWTIKIKSGWKFQDGTEVTAKSYVDAWNYGAYGPNGQNNNYFFAPIVGYDDLNPAPAADGSTPTPSVKEMSGLKVVDDTTFTVTLSSPVSVFPVMIGYTAFSPMPDSFFADPKAFADHPIGNGPFQFVSFTPSQSIKLTAYPDYTGPDKPKVKDVEFKIYTTPDAAYTDVVANNLDVLRQMPATALAGDLWKTDLAGRSVSQPISVIQTVTFPLYDKTFDNVLLRKAISEAIDRQKIIDIAFGGTRDPATSWVTPGIDGYQAGTCGEACTYNPEQAQADLKAAGGFKGTLTLAYNADGGHKEWVDATCASIKTALSIDCQGKAYPEFGPFRTAVGDNKMTGMFRTGWQADYPSIQNFLEPLYATGASANDGRWSNADFDNLMKEAAAAQSSDEANKLYTQSEAILAKDMPVIPMWYYAQQTGWSDRVDNVKVTWNGVIDLSSITVKS
jgi:oligopeptide transport system substrate-binding protein